MEVLYFTNEDITDWDIIPDIIRKTGDNVITHTSRVTLELVKKHKIDFIVSDRSRFLIKKDVIDYLPMKIVNLHPSYLPWNRGYHPNYWSIKERTRFGVSLHFIDEAIDTGDIIARSETFYSDDDTLRDTYNRLRRLMVNLFEACWPEVRVGKIKGISQDKNKGSIHYKKDFETIYDSLPNGWDTKVSLITENCI
ncbi:MAG: hypothetical protein CBB75_12335 [bacterium TMED15]|nr:MAG: hypothetical protein CBB75_12335 [bacterium TMED15]